MQSLSLKKNRFWADSWCMADLGCPSSGPCRDFKDYLIRQVYKSGVEVRLGTEATPEILKETGFDAIIAALGHTGSASGSCGRGRKDLGSPRRSTAGRTSWDSVW